MFPEEITLNHFITALNEKLKDKKVFPGEGIPVDQCKTLNQAWLDLYLTLPFGITTPLENQYLYVGIPRPLTELSGGIFIDKNSVYKIKTVTVKYVDTRGKTPPYDYANIPYIDKDVSDGCTLMRGLFTIEEYTDTHVEEMRSRFEEIKQNLSVCTDRIEDLGGLRLADSIRKQIKKWTLEDLV